MTTIAASVTHKQIAADSKCSTDRVHFQIGKLKELSDGSIFGAAGDQGLILKLYKFLYEGGEQLEAEAELDVLQLTHSGLCLFDTRTAQFYQIRSKFYAIGSGAEFALAAMSLGATPLQAIECAAKFDPDTGHPIDVMTLKRRKNVNSA